MNRRVNPPPDSLSPAAMPTTAQPVSDAHPHSKTPPDVRSRLLKMIKDNEQQRRKDVSSPLVQR